MDTATKPGSLVTTDWVTTHLDDEQIRLIEVDLAPGTYADGHIPGAVLWWDGSCSPS